MTWCLRSNKTFVFMRKVTTIMSDSLLTLITDNSTLSPYSSPWSEIRRTHLKPTKTSSEIHHAPQTGGSLGNVFLGLQITVIYKWLLRSSPGRASNTHARCFYLCWQEPCAFLYSREKHRLANNRDECNYPENKMKMWSLFIWMCGCMHVDLFTDIEGELIGSFSLSSRCRIKEN